MLVVLILIYSSKLNFGDMMLFDYDAIDGDMIIFDA